MRVIKHSIVGLLALGMAVGVWACANTLHGVAKDTSKVGEKVSEAAKTGDVKSALIADKDIDTSAINVDTISETKTVVLRGSVPTEAMKERAEMIARRDSPGYTVQNQLAVVPR
jgi:osmotically-inducible protein OsmY